MSKKKEEFKIPLSEPQQILLIEVLESQNTVLLSHQKLLKEMDSNFEEAVDYIKFGRIQKAMIVILGMIVIIQSFRLMS